MSIILVPEGEELEGLTRAEVLDLEVSDHDAEQQFRVMLDETHGPTMVAGYEYETSRALEELDPIAYRCGFADYVSAYLVEVDPDAYPLTYGSGLTRGLEEVGA